MGAFIVIYTVYLRRATLPRPATRARTVIIFIPKSYLGNQVRVKVQRLPKDTLEAVLGFQLNLGGVRLLLHKVKKRLHLPLGEGQHRVQVVHHPV